VSIGLTSKQPSVPLRALILSLAALAVAVLGAFLSPEVLGGYEALSWLLLLIPGFLLAYYRGWAGATRTMVAGTVLVLVFELGAEYVLASQVQWTPLVLVAGVLLTAGLGLGLLSELLIRERRRVEEALAVSEKRLQTTVTGAPIILFALDRKGTFTLSEGRGLEVLGLRSGQLVGRSAFAVYKDHPQMVDDIRRGLSGESVSSLLELDKYWFDARYRPIRDERGEIAGLIGIATDVTEQKQLEERFRQAQKMEAVGQLAGGIAHDFNNTLAIIAGNSELLLNELAPETQAWERVHGIKGAAERAATMTRQLLAFSREQPLEPRVLDLNDVVTEAERLLRCMIADDIRIVMGLDSMLDPVQVDPGQLEQVIINLAVNARDAMPGGGKLVIETISVELDELYADTHDTIVPGHYVMLAVSDTGTGMDAQTRSRIFEPFFTTKEEGKGTGLGLSTVYGIVKQSKGHIWVYSELGHGTTFKIYLPIAEVSDVELPELAPAPSEPVGGSETLLVVEDDDELRALTRTILTAYGYDVLEARGSAQALEIAALHAGVIHGLVTDVVMPQMNGRELAERLLPMRPQVKVLFLSGYTETAIVEHGILKPGVAFLQKPYSSEGLAVKVREVLDSRVGPTPEMAADALLPAEAILEPGHRHS
jgi:PAS domain S-box-containing protein